MYFKLIGKQPVPLAGEHVADEKTIFTLEGIHRETGISKRALTLLYEATFEPADDAILEACEAEQVLTGWQHDSGKVLLRHTDFGTLSDGDLAVFLVKCRWRNLDPWRNEAYPLWRWDGKRGQTLTVGIPINTQRALAHTSCQFAGMDAPEHHHENGKLVRTTQAVYRTGPGGQVVKFVGEAWLDEYYVQGSLWDEKPHNCLATAAERHALSRAFPMELAITIDGWKDPSANGMANTEGGGAAESTGTDR